MINKIKKIGSALLVSLLLTLNVQANFLPVQVQATDTVAGFPSAFKSSIIDPNQNVRFVVEKPDGSVVQIPAQADLEGVAKAELFGHQTKLAGDYKVAMVYPGSAESSPQASFKVYADEVSLTQSTLRSTLQLVEATRDSTFLVVTLFDQYRNPIVNHRVKLLSSRSEDKIEILNEGLTDQNGRANFKVTSSFPGVSIFTAMDVTANKVLEDREEIVFFTPNKIAEPSITDLFKADIGGDPAVLPGPIAKFKIDGLPSSAKVGDQLSLTVIAQDKDGNTAKNYTGTILISVPDDENALLPSNGEYTFRATDQGKFTFDLSLQFSKLGNQVVQVFDKSNFKIAGEQKIEITSGNTIPAASSNANLVIKSPSDGAEIGNQLVIITGKGPENINLKVFDNDIKIGDSETDGDGFFSFEAKNLATGNHQFYVMSEKGGVSEAVSVKIDTLPPVLNGFEVSPDSNVRPGEPLEVKVQSEPKLESVKIRFQGIEEELAELSDQPGNYVGSLVAPAKEGDFSVDVILIDSLANKAELLNKGVVRVNTPEPVLPPRVTDLSAEADQETIKVSWQPIESHERPIDYYNIYYGTDFNNLNQVKRTDQAFNDWTLGSLQPATQYFIAIKAVDTQGLESKDFSVTVAATTKMKNICGQNGSELNGVCICNQGWGGLTCDTPLNNAPIATTGLQAIAHKGAVTLSWPEFQGIQAFYYKVFIGFSEGQFNDYTITSNNQRSLLISDLIEGVPYYLAVAPLDLNKNQIAPVSASVQVVPTTDGLRPAANSPSQNLNQQLSKVPKTQEVGPETWWVISISILFAHFWYSRKKKLINH